MDVDGFWELIERSRQEASDPYARLGWLQRQLAQKPRAEIVDFQVWLRRIRRRADTWDMWGAAYLVCDSLCSGDGFWYFQVWLVGLGRDAFERVVANPDNLASLPEVLRLAGRPVEDWSDDEWPDWESLSYVAWEAYQQVTGEEEGLYDAMQAQGHHSSSVPDPTGERWDFEDPAEAAQRLPRLSWMFPLTDRATRDQRGREVFERMLAERGQTEEEFIAQFLGRPCPPRVRSIGIHRSPTGNSGRSREALNCTNGVASRLNGVPGRAFQARGADASTLPLSEEEPMVDGDGPTRGALELARSTTPATARRRMTALAAVARPAGEVAGLLLVEVLRSPRARAAALGLARSMTRWLAGKRSPASAGAEVPTGRLTVVKDADTGVLVHHVETALVVFTRERPSVGPQTISNTRSARDNSGKRTPS